MKLTMEQQYMLSVLHNTTNTMPADALATLGVSHRQYRLYLATPVFEIHWWTGARNQQKQPGPA